MSQFMISKMNVFILLEGPMEEDLTGGFIRLNRVRWKGYKGTMQLEEPVC